MENVQQTQDSRNAGFLEQTIPISHSNDSDLTKWELSALEIIEEFKNELEGKTFNYETETWDKTGEQIVNTNGMNIIISLLKGMVHRVVFLSNLDEQMVYQIARDFSNDLTQVIFNNIETFDIDFEKGYHIFIITKASYVIFASVSRAKDQGERNFMKTATRIVHNINSSQEQKEKKGWWIFGKGD